MPREYYSITPIRALTVEEVNRMITQLNKHFAEIALLLSKLEGRDGQAPEFSSDINLGGKRIKNVGRTEERADVPSIGELFDRKLLLLRDDVSVEGEQAEVGEAATGASSVDITDVPSRAEVNAALAGIRGLLGIQQRRR